MVQIRRGVELNNIHHVKKEALVADVDTRREKVQIKDVLTGSRWQNGVDWMKMTVGQAFASGDIKAALEYGSMMKKKMNLRMVLCTIKSPKF